MASGDAHVLLLLTKGFLPVAESFFLRWGWARLFRSITITGLYFLIIIEERIINCYDIIQDWEEPGQTLQPEEDRAKNSQDSTKPLDSTQSRSANRFRPNSFNLAQLNPAQQRLFFGALNPFNSNTNNWFGNLLQTSTLVTVTVPSTLVTAIISTCIPSGQFLAGSAAIPCVRRRRQIAGEIEDQLDQAQVSPTLVQQFVSLYCNM